MCAVNFANVGLRDNYSGDHLFSRMRYNTERSRENIQLHRETEREREKDGGLEDI